MLKPSVYFSKTTEIHYTHPKAVDSLSNSIKELLKGPFVTICIGTDRCIGDCLGPLIGHQLIKEHFPYPVYGTLECPIHAVNMEEKLPSIQFQHYDLPVLAIDASLGKRKSIGNIQFKKGPISPGKGVGKNLPAVGDYSLIGIVDTYNHLDELTIHQVRLNLIHKMSLVIAKALFSAIK